MSKIAVPEMTEIVIIDMWKRGYTVQQLSKEYVRNKKSRGTRVTQLEAQKYIEPIIFNYQINLMRS